MNDAKDGITAQCFDLFVTADTRNWHLCSYSCPDVSNVQSRLGGPALKYGHLTPPPVALRVWFSNEHHRHLLRASLKCKFLGLIPVLLTQITLELEPSNSCVNMPSRKFWRRFQFESYCTEPPENPSTLDPCPFENYATLLVKWASLSTPLFESRRASWLGLTNQTVTEVLSKFQSLALKKA